MYAIGQAALETCLLILIGYCLQYFTHKKVFATFIGITFVLLVFHLFDFILERLIGGSIWDTLGNILSDTFGNFLFLLEASGIPLWNWVIFFLFLAFLPIFGILFYKLTEAVINRKYFSFSTEVLPISAFCVISGLVFWDISASKLVHPNTYHEFIQCLPWKFTFLYPKSILMNLRDPPLKPPSEKQTIDAIVQNDLSLTTHPNIYLFVIESLRDDFITEDVAPNLFSFKNASVPIATTLSNANGSHLSWYSLFHSQFSHHWHLAQEQNWSLGSAPLAFLKKMGYQIHLYTSAQLGYFGLERLLFGQDQYLLNSNHKFHHHSTLPAALTDATAIQTMVHDVQENRSLQEGQIFLTFLDSTHFNYSWPKNWKPKFIPFAKTISYFGAFFSKERIHKIKNRYRNAVNYIDHLFGEFLQNIPNKEHAIIIVTGDHGEEFFEKGHLLHSSHIVKEQTSIPILMYFEGKTFERKKLASQMDVFPSIIDYLTGKVPTFCRGESIFHKKADSFAFISRVNAGRSPYEFCIHNGQYKMIGQFANRTNILDSKSLRIVSLQTFDDVNVEGNTRWIQKEFGMALKHLFPNE